MVDFEERGSSLSQLNFSDLQVQLTGRQSAFFQVAAASAHRQQVLPVPLEFLERVAALRYALQEYGKDSGTIEFDDMRLRFQVNPAGDQEIYVVLRRLAGQMGELENLRIDPTAIALINRFAQIRSGLILIMGGTGQGKTTLAAHIYKRLVTNSGGRGITIQDPIEYATQGPMGEGGFSLDFPVYDNDWASPLQRSMRSNPSYIFVGEILTPQAAAMTISAAATGTLVISTIHGGTIGEGITRLISMAAGAPQAGTMEFYRAELGKSLIAAMTTTLSPYGPDVMILFGETPEQRTEIGRIITAPAEHALSSTETGWTKRFAAPRRAR